MFVRDWRSLAASLAALLLAATAMAVQPSGEKLTSLAEEGEYIFRQKCSACHTIGEGDKPTGPDLAGVMERRDRQWLTSFITDPGKPKG